MDVETPQNVAGNHFEDVKMVRALVVDDDPIVRKLHCMYLNKHVLKNEVAETSQEALDLFDSGKSFALVLMDLEMPVMNGARATEELRAMGVKATIVGVTACGVEKERAAFLAAGLDGCVDKTLTARAFIVILDELALRVL
ncbi:response regulator 24 [Striga hermonthica]|uniref:Response regulator 24 n=1 Tax=Striga hermonthica TaxID=68872 RepID=A0A9N7N0T9_STRHE|nr:response regulator 24 [Striga hermonthica]